MPRHKRPHPVYSLQFWLLVLVAVCATAAWKLELIHIGRHAPAPAPEVNTVDLGDSGDADDRLLHDSDIFLSQSEPSPLPAAELAGSAPVSEPRVMPRADSVAQSPFGPAAPEFVPAPAAQPAPRGRVAPVSAATTPGGRTPNPAAIILAGGDETSAAPDAPEAPSAPESPSNLFDRPPAVTNEAPAFDFTEIDANLNAGTTDGDVAAHRALSELYWQHPELRPQLYSRIEQTSRRIYIQSQPHYFPEYIVEPGETLQAIAKKYNVTWEYLERLNKTPAPRLRAGQAIKVIKGPFAAVVDLSDYEMTIHCRGHYVSRFPVGIGKDGSTPVGSFTVEDKVKNPRYDGPDGSIAADDPANPIGERWISLGHGYGIHGTIDPDSIGKCESRGCIRMYNEDVEAVYDLLTIGSEVVIQR